MKIIPEGNGYVGYFIKNDEVIFQTKVCKDTISCSRELSKFSASVHPQAVPLTRSNKAVQTPSASFKQMSSSAPRRCCGR